MTPSRKGLATSKPSRSTLEGFDIQTTVRSPLPRIPFEAIARMVLGKHYELSVVICGDKLARHAIQDHRPASAGTHKSYAPNVLSFPLTKDTGEIFLNVRKAEREAKHMGISPRMRIAHLYVHGCFHLAGHDHSDDMEHREDVILSHFNLV